MKILKFGGTSVATPAAIQRVVDILRRTSEDGPVAVVVSAFGGVTNRLLEATDLAAARDSAYREVWQELSERHGTAAQALAADAERVALGMLLEERFEDLGDLLHGVFLLRESSPRTRDAILAYGERLSSEVVAAALRASGVPASAVDSRELVVTDDTFGRAQVDFDTTYPRIQGALVDREDLAVVTGFAGATAEGHTTTLGRGGSDYTAALLAAAVQAEAVELWTDVDGVLSADPRKVPEAFPQATLSYSELMELSHFGAKVVYPPTIHPVRGLGIPLYIKNTFHPEAPGTRIHSEGSSDPRPSGQRVIRGLASIDRVVLLRLEGAGMVGVPGIAMRLFGALAKHEVSVILISQSSSEHSICFAVEPGAAAAAERAVAEEFQLERQVGLIDELVVEGEMAVVAAVGEEMRRRPGIAGQLFRVLGREGISVRAIAQGSSERNISLVVTAAEEGRALRSVHRAFFGPLKGVLEVAVLGVGRVGSTLLEQLRDAAPRLLAEEGVELRLVAVANSRRMAFDEAGLPWGDWQKALAEGDERGRGALAHRLVRIGSSPRVLADCTASGSTSELLTQMLAQGGGVVSANKRPVSGPFEDFEALRRAEGEGSGALVFEATVGAGLPVLSTLSDLRRTGDQILQIDGVLSGTLNSVLDRLSAELPLSEAVRQASDEGLTEPHPWDDLSGLDVARKLCILGRLSGHPLEMVDIEVEPLLPHGDWGSFDLDTFWQRLPTLDADFEIRRQQAEAEGRRLRYVASLDEGGVGVGLRAVEVQHPAHGVRGADNLIAFYTTRYDASPLAVRGPGAGTAVTAAGVFVDILRAWERLSAVGR